MLGKALRGSDRLWVRDSEILGAGDWRARLLAGWDSGKLWDTFGDSGRLWETLGDSEMLWEALRRLCEALGSSGVL